MLLTASVGADEVEFDSSGCLGRGPVKVDLSGCVVIADQVLHPLLLLLLQLDHKLIPHPPLNPGQTVLVLSVSRTDALQSKSIEKRGARTDPYYREWYLVV